MSHTIEELREELSRVKASHEASVAQSFEFGLRAMEIRDQIRQMERDAEAEQVREFAWLLAQTHRLSDSLHDEVFRLAWDRGHAYGLHEVESEYEDLADLVKLAMREQAQ